MVSSFLSQRFALLLLPLPLLGGCSPDRFLPPAEIGAAPDPDWQLVGRVDGDKQLIGRVGDPSIQEADQTGPTDGGVDDYPAAPMAAEAQQPIAQDVFSTEEPPQASSGIMAADGTYAIPPDGVSMDAALGIDNVSETAAPETVAAPAQPIAPEDMVIAEGATEQPVVDGIGTDEPTYVVPAQPMPLAQPMLDEGFPDEPAYTGAIPKK